MVSSLHLDRREFLALSALATAATLLPDSLHADQPSDPGLISLRVSGDAQSGFGVTILFRDQPIARHHRGGEFSAIFKTASTVSKTGPETGKPPPGVETQGESNSPELCSYRTCALRSLSTLPMRL